MGGGAEGRRKEAERNIIYMERVNRQGNVIRESIKSKEKTPVFQRVSFSSRFLCCDEKIVTFRGNDNKLS